MRIKPKRAGGEAIILAIMWGNEMLLIRQPDRDDPQWKMPGETKKSGETLAQAIKRAAREEARLVIPLPNTVGDKAELINNKIQLGELHRRKIVTETSFHTQYFYGICLRYRSQLHALDNRKFPEDKTETICTKVFHINEIAQLPDLLEQQQPLFDILFGLLKKPGAARPV